MAISRQQKETLVDHLAKGLAESKATFVVGFKGVTVEKIESLRKSLRKEGGSLKVAKVRLMKRALAEAGAAKGLEPFLNEQVAFVFARTEPSVIAKCLYTFAKANDKFSLQVGYMDSAILDKESVGVIATLPSREVLLAQLLATIMAPVTSIAVLLKALEEKKSKEEVSENVSSLS